MAADGPPDEVTAYLDSLTAVELAEFISNLEFTALGPDYEVLDAPPQVKLPPCTCTHLFVDHALAPPGSPPPRDHHGCRKCGCPRFRPDVAGNVAGAG